MLNQILAINERAFWHPGCDARREKYHVFSKALSKVNTVFAYALFASIFLGSMKLVPIMGTYFSLSFYLSIVAIPLAALEFFLFDNDAATIEVGKICLLIFSMLASANLGMALVQQPFFGGYKGGHPILVFGESFAKYLVDFAIFIYFVFSFKKMRRKPLFWVIVSLMVLWMILAGVQFLIFRTENLSLAAFYDGADILRIFPDSSLFIRQAEVAETFRAYGFSTEPASAAFFAGALCPVLLCYLVFFKKSIPWSKKLIISLFFVLFFVAVFFTKSASVYACFLVSILTVGISSLLSSSIKKVYYLFVLVPAIIVVVVLFAIPYSREILVNGFIVKIVDFSNQSTLHRYSSIYNDFLVFLKYPLFGVGDGLQGYYYVQHIGGTVFSYAYETHAHLLLANEIVDGGPFIPSFISGFGIFGFLAVFPLLRAMNSLTRWQRKTDPVFFIFRCTFYSNILNACVSSGIHRNFWLLLYLAIPFYKGVWPFKQEKKSSKQCVPFNVYYI